MKNAFAFLFFIALWLVSHAQNNSETYTLQELKVRFKHENYNEKILLDFQKTMVDLRKKPELHEDIPGEIISWFTLNGKFSWHSTYILQKDNVKKVETVPKEDSFLKVLNRYVPEKSKFSYGYDLWSFAFVSEKLPDNYYLIKATVKSFNSHPEIPNDDILSYHIEYKTKDFETFQLVKLKDIHTDKWIEVNKN